MGKHKGKQGDGDEESGEGVAGREMESPGEASPGGGPLEQLH